MNNNQFKHRNQEEYQDQTNDQNYYYRYPSSPNSNQNTDNVPYWRIWLLSIGAALFHIIVLNIAAVITGIVMAIASKPSSEAEIINLFFSSDMQNWASIIMSVICIPLYTIFLYFRNRKYKGSLGLKKMEAKSLASMGTAIFGSLGIVTGLLLLLDFIGNYIEFIAKWIQDYQELVEMIVSDSGNMILQIIGTVVLVPIAEELLFRGIILGELNFRYSPRVVVLLQALLFGIFHMNPLQSLYTFIPGLLLGIAYYQTGNLIVPIIMHMIFNFFGGVINFMVPEEVLSWITSVEIFMAIFAVFIIIRFFIKTKPDQPHKLEWVKQG